MSVSSEREMVFYIGIPFCKNACSYCHYRPNLKFGKKVIPETYIVALLSQIQTTLVQKRIHNKTLLSCYLGGGTPSALSVNQIERIFSVFQTNDITFQEKSIEIHPAHFDEAIIDTSFFNRFSIGIQSTDLQNIKKWNREPYLSDVIRNLFYSIKRKDSNNIINFDFLMEDCFSDTDIDLVKELLPDTVVFYPKTGLRNEKEAARTLAHLKKIELLLDDVGYYRINDYSFHFFKRQEALSKYAYGEYSFTSDIIGFGHNSISRLGEKSFLSLYSDDYKSWETKERPNDIVFELLWGSLPYGIPLALEDRLPKDISGLLRQDKHFRTKYLPLEKKVWISLFEKVKTYSNKKKDIIWKGLFWSDNREKDIELFFNCLDMEYNKIYSDAIVFFPSCKRIPKINILIEGIDGSGKDTFANFLIGYLRHCFIKNEDRSISLVGLPSSQSIFGQQCKDFIEKADKSVPYKDIIAFLTKNREDFCEKLNRLYPGLHIFVRSILTEQGTLLCLYPNHRVAIDNMGVSHIDLCIVLKTDPALARNRIVNRGEVITWRESPQYLEYFNSFFLKYSQLFSKTIIIDNTSNSLLELKAHALKIALKIYNSFSEKDKR